jgi:hypothetical protein
MHVRSILNAPGILIAINIMEGANLVGIVISVKMVSVIRVEHAELQSMMMIAMNPSNAKVTSNAQKISSARNPKKPIKKLYAILVPNANIAVSESTTHVESATRIFIHLPVISTATLHQIMRCQRLQPKLHLAAKWGRSWKLPLENRRWTLRCGICTRLTSLS